MNKHLLFIYRSNEQFDATIPQIITALRKHENGYVIDTQVFPRDTTENVIAQWTEENVEKLLECSIFYDLTLIHSVWANQEINIRLQKSGVGIFQWNAKHDTSWKNLDNLFAWTAAHLVHPPEVKEDPEDFEGYYTAEATKSVFVEVFQKMNSVSQPQRVFISEKLAAAHDPFNYGIYRRKYKGYGHYQDCKEEANADVVADLRECLSKAGVVAEVIAVESVKSPDLREALTEDWILYDRHEDRPRGGAKKFRLPLNNLVEDATRLQMIFLDSADFLAELQRNTLDQVTK
jgi:hypothetical protein